MRRHLLSLSIGSAIVWETGKGRRRFMEVIDFDKDNTIFQNFLAFQIIDFCIFRVTFIGWR
jgi:hypothetical protein